MDCSLFLEDALPFACFRELLYLRPLEGPKFAFAPARLELAGATQADRRVRGGTVEALNIASATNAHVDTISVASPAACGPLSPSYNVEAKPVTRLPRPNILQVQHCIRGRGATDIMSQCFP